MTTHFTPADELEIRNLVSCYCLATDDGDADRFMATWVGPEDFGGYDSGPFGHLRTWDELQAFERHHVAPGGPASGKRHQATNVVVAPVSADEAHVTHDLLVLEVAKAPRLVATARYDRSVVVRTSAGWRFKFRKLDLDPGFFALMEQEGQGTGDVRQAGPEAG